MNTKAEITGFQPTKEYFIGIDSDGTVFDSMNIKHVKSMCPAALEVWNIGEYQKEFEKIWYKFNLYSGNRGANRFFGLLHAFNELKEIVQDIKLPDFSPLKDFVKKSDALSNAALEKWMQKHPSPLLDDVMRWSLDSDKLFEEYTQGLLPFANVEDALKVMAGQADIMVVSSASGKGLDKDWSFSGLNKYTSLIAGQETGSKKAQLQMGTSGKYCPKRILMIGDAPGDFEAARFIDAEFFPVMPGSEEESWLFLKEEVLPRFFAGTYYGEYEKNLVRKFLDFLV